MSEKLKTLKTVETERPEPPLLDQIVEIMERRDNARAARPQPLEIKTFDELRQWAEMAARSGMVPKDYIGKPDAIMIAVDLGAELGLKRMQAVQGIAVINGRPSIWGDALWALVLSQPSLEDAREWIEGEGDNRVAHCEIKRRGKSLVRKSFSVADAKRAGLWKTEPRTKKQGRDGTYEVDSGPWYSYPERMMQMRARGFCCRDAYADALKGLQMAEEVMDYAPEEAATPVRMPSPQPEKAAAKAPSEKTVQNAEALINQIASCEDPDEWIKLDDKSKKWRTLAVQWPELSAQVEEAFAAARDRLFPPADGEREAGMEG
jgi:hypothetical protein